MEVTTVAARGEAEAEFNLVGFNITLTEVAGSVPTAKGKLTNRIEDLETSLTALRSKLGLEFVKNSVRSSSAVNEKHEYNRETNKNEFVGFEISYSLSFEIDEMDRVNEVYDTLTSLDKVRVGQPVFSLKNREKLNKKALKHAFEKVRARFDMECDVLGLDSTDFEIGTWEVSYSDSHRAPKVARSFAMTAGAPGAPRGGSARGEAVIESSGFGSAGEPAINFVAGLAHVIVNLEVGYHPKPVRVGDRIAKIVREGTSASALKENGHV